MNFKNRKKSTKISAFTLAKGATHVAMSDNHRKSAFTLAEVLVTLSIIGVVAAITLPTLLTNINERIQKEQVRSAKYKLTLATDKMKSMGLLSERYATTQDFVNELSKHFKLAKICDKNHLTECWPTDEINLTDGTTVNVNSITTGESLKALALSTKSTETMGIITADGVPMILVYSPNCTPLEQERTYTWSTVDNKPETNATTNCISAIMDINGSKKPNRIGKDVRTFNSLFGSVKVNSSTYGPLSYSDCTRLKEKLGINECFKDLSGERNDDYWGGAVKYCHDRGLHLPSEQTLATIAGTRYGRSDITSKTIISTEQFAKANWRYTSWYSETMSCEQIWRQSGSSGADKIICVPTSSIGDDNQASISLGDATLLSSVEVSATTVMRRNIISNTTHFNTGYRNSRVTAWCVGD